ncbi:hypothetical protein RFI_27315, partial [Reticulomyxa filosa]
METFAVKTVSKFDSQKKGSDIHIIYIAMPDSPQSINEDDEEVEEVEEVEDAPQKLENAENENNQANAGNENNQVSTVETPTQESVTSDGREARSSTMVFRDSFDANNAFRDEPFPKRSASTSSSRKDRMGSVFSGYDNAILSRIKTSYGLRGNSGNSFDATGTIFLKKGDGTWVAKKKKMDKKKKGLEEAIQGEVAAGTEPVDAPLGAGAPITAKEELGLREDLE